MVGVVGVLVLVRRRLFFFLFLLLPRLDGLELMMTSLLLLLLKMKS